MTEPFGDNSSPHRGPPGQQPNAPYLCEILGMVIRHWLPFTLFGLVVLAMAGVIGHSFGLPHLFRDDPQLLEYGWGALRNSPGLWGSAAATLLLIAILTGVFVNKRLHDERLATTWRDLSWYLVTRGLPFVLPLLLAVAWRSSRTADLATPSTLVVELSEALLGVLIGAVLAFLAMTVMSLLYVGVYAWLADTRLGRATTRFLQRVTVQSLSHNQSPHAAWVALYFFAGVLLVTLPFMISEMIVPAVALCILLVWVILAYFLLAALRPLVRHPAILLVLLFYGIYSYDAFRNRFPGFAVAGQDIDLYDCPLQLHDLTYSCEALRKPAPSAPEPQATRSLAGKTAKTSTASEVVAPPSTLDPQSRALMDAWRIRPAIGAPFEQQTRGLALSPEAIDPTARIDPHKHKLVVITTSGGAYRAAFWTAMVLDQLVGNSRRDGDLEGFADQIRLLTGASGGMVASAYFAALASPDGWSRADAPSIRQRLVDDIRNARDRNNQDSAGRFKTGFPIDRDSLGPVAQQALQRDAVRYMLSSILPQSWIDWRRWGDRGLALEEQWATLDLSFRDLEQGVAEGWRPWLIVSPMIADTGQPMLISNVPTEPVLERVEGAAIDLFDLFPDQRDQLKVATAVRMNASFPYISPAVSLPTVPKRRIVDAGYYDNYGVNAALAWLSQDGMMEYLRSHVAGVVVVQIRAYGTSSGIPEPGGDQRPDFPLLPEWLTSPLTGVMSARSSSMLYRNNEQLQLFSSQFCEHFVQTVALENRAKDKDIGMSWYLRPEEIEVMRAELSQDWNQQALDKLVAIWGSDQRCDPAAGPGPTTTRPSAPASIIPAGAGKR